MPQVFISHSSEDRSTAEGIRRYLETAGIECWIAPRNIPPGSDWTQGIMHGLQECPIFVLVFTRAANQSKHVRREVGAAFELGHEVIPIRTEEVVPSAELSYFLNSVQWFDAIQPPLEPHLEALRRRVEFLLQGGVLPPTESQVTPMRATAPPATIPGPKPKRRWLLLIAALSCLLLLGLGTAAWLLLKPAKTVEPTPAALDPKGIAVLPFENLSTAKEDGYFADGVQEEILNDLAKLGQLRVISRSSVMRYRADAGRDLRQIATVLGVSKLLEGTVQREGNRVRVSTELVDALSNQTLWADRFDRDLTDIFSVQSEVAQTVAGKLQAQLTGAQKKEIDQQPTENLAAYDLYLQGKELVYRGFISQNDDSAQRQIQAGIAKLEQAIGLDPQFALAYCALVNAHDYLYVTFFPTPERRTAGDQAIEQARRLAPNLAEVHLAYAGHLYYCYRDYERLRPELELAKRGLPNSGELLGLEAYIDRRQGRFAESVERFTAALQVDPTSLELIQQFALLQEGLGHWPEAERLYGRAIELAPNDPQQREQKANFIFLKTGNLTELKSFLGTLVPGSEDYRNFLTDRIKVAIFERDWPTARACTLEMGDADSFGQWGVGAGANLGVPAKLFLVEIARLAGDSLDTDEFHRLRETFAQRVAASSDDPMLLGGLALLDALLGHTEQALPRAERAAQLLPPAKDPIDGVDLQTNLAAVLAWSGQLDRAFQLLNQVAAASFPSYLVYGTFLVDPVWDPLRKDPRYPAILAKLKPKE
jgi:TolB-like protein/Tfp pilus assembly protein PilF